MPTFVVVEGDRGVRPYLQACDSPRNLPVMRACICGAVGCRRHGRQSRSYHALRDYGSGHQHRVKVMLATTPEICARCGGGPRVGDPWEGGHIQAQILGGGPELQREHRSCNRSHGARLKQILR